METKVKIATDTKTMGTKKERIPSRGWLLLICSWSIIFLSGFGMLGLGMIVPNIRQQFHLSLTTVGYLNTITFVAQLIITIPISLIASRTNPKFVLAFSFIATAIAFLLHGFATGAPMLMAGRALLAFGLAGIMPPMALVKNNWVPLPRMSQINGLEQFANTLGQVVGTLAVSTLIVLLGNWQNMMSLLGFLGVAVTILWLVMYRYNPEKGPEKLLKNEPFLAPLKEALKQKAVWLLALGWPGTSLVWIAFTTFWPTYATSTLHLSIAQAGLAIGMIPLASVFASLTSPTITNWIGYDKLMIWPWGIILCFAYFGGLMTSNIVLLCITFFIAGYGAFAFVPIAFTTLFKLDNISPAAVSLGIGVITVIFDLGGALAGVIVGKLTGFMDLRTALAWCCLSPILWLLTTIFLPELGRKHDEKKAAALNKTE